MSTTTYTSLKALQSEVAIIGRIEALLEWDERCYLPEKASPGRAEQLAWIAGLRHRKATDSAIGDLLGQLKGESGLSEQEQVNVREWQRDYDLAMKLPVELVEEMSRITTLAQRAWRDARENNNFQAFAPHLSKVLELKRRQADCYGWSDEPYSALLDTYEPGAKTSEVAAVLSQLRDRLVPLVRKVAEAPRRFDTSFLRSDFPVEAQRVFAERAARAIGYDFERGRLDVTTHPFCTTIGQCDVRITTRFYPDYWNAAFFGVLHEAGHAIYEQNLEAEFEGTPMGDAVSLGIHESQSRMWENFVGRSEGFWRYWYGELQQTFPTFQGVPRDRFHFAINEVKSSFIRVEADEVTYNLHILLRFELERALLSGDLSVADLSGVWRERFQSYFGIPVPTDTEGCLQDIHWSAGLIGYFPTYSLGNLNAAMLYAKASEDLGDLNAMFAMGEYAPLRTWLTDRIHRHGRRYPPAKLIEVATGRPLDSTPLVDYLTAKVETLYQVNE
ncbi:MAG: carboxypeptidase M32 [Calditrichaeota bacterium]|nr:carboxypeptidase M32 [Calditrichota bacterium]